MEKNSHDRLISVVVPIYNEARNLSVLFDRLTGAFANSRFAYEIIAIDDGSRDNSYQILQEIAQKNSHVRVIRFTTNFGQTAALSAGIDRALGHIIVTIDSDLENDPTDIMRLLEKLDEGYDIVSGWRKDRWHGAFFSRKLPSAVANWLISKLSGVSLHDYGCTLKAYRADLVKGVKLYGEMHRFIPAYASWQGGRVAEIQVLHHPRVHGTSNYGFGRTFRVLFDLVFIQFMRRYFNRPMHFFGGWGFVSLALGVFAGFVALALRLFYDLHLVQTPLPILSALFIIVGIQLTLFGVLAEILMRTYYESQDKRPYAIKDVIGIDR